MGVSDLLDTGSSQNPLVEGIIAEDATTVNEKIEVTIPSFDDATPWGPCAWTPSVNDAGEVVYPEKGDPCLVALAATDEPGAIGVWIVMWWPYGD
jgi:hypothetical protein